MSMQQCYLLLFHVFLFLYATLPIHFLSLDMFSYLPLQHATVQSMIDFYRLRNHAYTFLHP